MFGQFGSLNNNFPTNSFSPLNGSWNGAAQLTAPLTGSWGFGAQSQLNGLWQGSQLANPISGSWSPCGLTTGFLNGASSF